jgi:ABC-type polar amino acid transport system ATPase subunit
MKAPLIKISNLRKTYGQFTALHGIDLEIAQGEVLCVVGPSGSGKSTLIRCINHLEPFEDGSEITGDGIPVRPGPDLDQVRAEVGMVFQSFNLFPHMTVLRNVMLAPIRVRKMSELDAEKRARDLLETACGDCPCPCHGTACASV